jgi:hypothetical protein
MRSEGAGRRMGLILLPLWRLLINILKNYNS